MRRRIAFALLAVAGCSGPSDPQTQTPPPPKPFTATCTAAAPTAEAQRTAGRQGDGSVILPGGRKLTPAGTVLDLGGFPLALRLLPGDRYAVVTDGGYGDEALRIVDLAPADPAHAVVSKYDYLRTEESAHAPALFYGIAVTANGKRVYVSNGGHDPVADAVPNEQHYNTIDVFDVVRDASGVPSLAMNEGLRVKLYWQVANQAAQNRYPSGIQLSADEKLLYVANQLDNSLSIMDLSPGRGYGEELSRAAVPGIAPYDVAVDETSHTAFVSLWGGLTKGRGQYVDGIAVVDVTDPLKPTPLPDVLPTGKAAEAELIIAGKLYVANADADTVSVVDLASRTAKTMPVTASARIGAAPNHVAVDAAAGRLYLANAGENAVAVLDLATLALKGRIPTAWYPTAVAVRGDGSLVIASAKGLGLGPLNHSPGKNEYMQGVLQVLPRPDDAALAAMEKQVAQNLTRPRDGQVALDCQADKPKAFPLPADDSGRSPIEHVFLIVRENKTFDAVLGDLGIGAGDPTLAMFGGDITPNAHAIARTFVTLDNFYSQAEQSLQGHEWTTASISNDYSEKGWNTTWGRATRPTGAFASGTYERLGFPGSPTIFTHLDAAKLTYHNYGEVVNVNGAAITLDQAYPGVIFNLGTLDVVKIAYVIDGLTDADRVVPFSYILLPNDHTYGTTPGKPTPQSMVADNDEATGRFLDALSRSSLWPKSIVFVIEDDPQDGGDHIEPHRSLCLVASPWIKRGYKSSVIYDVPAMYRTIELILGVGPMNEYDANAAPMYDLFQGTPDATPYTYIPRKIPVEQNAIDAPLGDESARIDWSKPDQAPLGRILWKALHGKDAEPPWRQMGRAAPFLPDDDDD